MATIEMFDNFTNFLQMLNELKSDPVAFAAKNKYNIPQGMTDPYEMTQYLLNTGQTSQDQVNQYMKLRNNPFFQKLFGGR